MFKKVVFLLFISFLQRNYCTSGVQNRQNALSDSDLKTLAHLTNISDMNTSLDKILIPRVVGSKGHSQVFSFLKERLEHLEWNVKVDVFNAPVKRYGQLRFRNIIADLTPNASRYLILAAHYDSLDLKDFLGAIDSAVPCVMILNLITVMKDKYFEQLRSSDSDLSLRVIFFDGEEAFGTWSATNSLFGSRHLAKSWLDSNDLHRIDLLVLLDLIGVRNPTFHNYLQNNHISYGKMRMIEQRLSHLNQLEEYNTDRPYFNNKHYYGNIEDDHTPFSELGVQILHLIHVPFPTQWHTVGDNRNIISMKTVENLNKILRVFVAEHLHLSLL